MVHNETPTPREELIDAQFAFGELVFCCSASQFRELRDALLEIIPEATHIDEKDLAAITIRNQDFWKNRGAPGWRDLLSSLTFVACVLLAATALVLGFVQIVRWLIGS